jgi:hypothetical protein
MQYPDSALPAVQLAIMAVVVVAALAVWLILVFLAAREPRGKAGAADTGHRDEKTTAPVTPLTSDIRAGGKAAALSDMTPLDRTCLQWLCQPDLAPLFFFDLAPPGGVRGAGVLL